MTTVTFPAAIARLQDSKYFGLAPEDKTIKGESEGGYVHARPRHTRKPRLTFKTGFTELTQGQKDELLTFFEQVGCYAKFLYIDPTSSVQYTVRFAKPLSFKYAGIGPTRLWNVTDIELTEA